MNTSLVRALRNGQVEVVRHTGHDRIKSCHDLVQNRPVVHITCDDLERQLNGRPGLIHPGYMEPFAQQSRDQRAHFSQSDNKYFLHV